MASHSSALAWRIPGTGEPGGLPSMGSHRVGHDWSDAAAAAAAVTIFPLPTHLRFPNVIIFISLTLQMCCRHLEEDATGSTFQGLKLGWGQAPERDYLCLFQKNFLVIGTWPTSTYLAIGPLQGSTNRGEKNDFLKEREQFYSGKKIYIKWKCIHAIYSILYIAISIHILLASVLSVLQMVSHNYIHP